MRRSPRFSPAPLMLQAPDPDLNQPPNSSSTPNSEAPPGPPISRRPSIAPSVPPIDEEEPAEPEMPPVAPRTPSPTSQTFRGKRNRRKPSVSDTSSSTKSPPRRRQKPWLASLTGLLGLALLCITGAFGSVTLHDPRFLAYDCSRPWQIREFASRPNSECPKRQGSVTKEPTRVYQLLQKETKTTIKAIRCARRSSIVEFYCGAYDHSTPSASTSYYYWPRPLGYYDCRRLAIGDHQYVPASTTDKEHQPQPKFHTQENQWTIARYFKAGHDYRAWDVNDWTISCKNSIMMREGKAMRMVSHVSDQLIWKHHELEWDRDSGTLIDLERGQQLMNCTVGSDSCDSMEFTYLITDPRTDTDLSCPLGLMRESRANIFRDTKPNGTFTEHLVSHPEDSGHFYLPLTGKVNECSRMLYSTSDPDVFVFPLPLRPDDPATWGQPIRRTLSDQSHSLYKQTTQLANYQYYRISGQAQEEFDVILQNDCYHRKRTARTEHYLEAHVPGLLAALMSNGTFITRSGELSYLYSCRPLHVIAIEAKRCYDKLPVRVATVEQTVLNNTLMTTGQSPAYQEPTLFMSPESRILTPFAVEETCSTVLVSKYQAVGGQWYSVTPKVLPAPPPRPLPLNLRKPSDVFSPEDMLTGTVYVKRRMSNLQRRLFIRVIQQVIDAKFARQIRLAQIQPNDENPISLTDMFRDAMPTIQNAATSAVKKMLGWVYDFGVYVSAFVGAGYIYAAARWICQAIFGMAMQYQAKGFGRHMLWGLPNLAPAFTTRFYRNYKRKMRRGDPERGPTPPPRPMVTLRDHQRYHRRSRSLDNLVEDGQYLVLQNADGTSLTKQPVGNPTNASCGETTPPAAVPQSTAPGPDARLYPEVSNAPAPVHSGPPINWDPHLSTK